MDQKLLKSTSGLHFSPRDNYYNSSYVTKSVRAFTYTGKSMLSAPFALINISILWTTWIWRKIITVNTTLILWCILRARLRVCGSIIYFLRLSKAENTTNSWRMLRLCSNSCGQFDAKKDKKKTEKFQDFVCPKLSKISFLIIIETRVYSIPIIQTSL